MVTVVVPKTELHLVTAVGLFLNGQAPTVAVAPAPPDTVVTPGLGALEIHGKTPALEIFIPNAESSLFFSGLAPNVSQDETPPPTARSPDVGSMSFLGYGPSRSYGLLFTGHAPSITGGDIVIETGDPNDPDNEQTTLTLTTFTPEIVSNNVISVPVGGLTLTAYTPSIPFLATPGKGTLNLTGLQPRFEAPFVNEVPKASLGLTGLAPRAIAPPEQGPTGGFERGYAAENRYRAERQRKKDEDERKKRLRQALRDLNRWR